MVEIREETKQGETNTEITQIIQSLQKTKEMTHTHTHTPH